MKAVTFNPKSYWEDRLASNPDIRGVGYTSLGSNYNRWLYRIRRRVFLRQVLSLPVEWQEAEVLDVGSGTGFYIRLWDEIGAGSVVGADLTSTAVGRLQQQFPGKRFLELDIGVPLDEFTIGPFDVVSAFDVLFHIVDDDRYRRAISNIHSVLQPGGYFVFSEQLLHSPTKRGGHVVERSMTEVLGILEETGFQVIARKPMFVLMNYPVDTNRAACQFAWKAITWPIRKIRALSEPLGAMLGALLYPLEAVLTGVLPGGPSTELVICRKRLDQELG